MKPLSSFELVSATIPIDEKAHYTLANVLLHQSKVEEAGQPS